MRKIRYRFIAIISILALTLIACDDSRHLKDLKDYVANLKARKPAAVIKPIVKLEAPTKTVATPIDDTTRRSPFADNVEPTQKVLSTEPLQMYALTTLQYKGVVTENSIPLGYVLTPANKIFSVKVGDTIGNHSGKIIGIYPDRIDIEETTTEGTLNSKRIVSLQLKDGNP